MVLFQFPKELISSTAAGDLIFFSRQANSNETEAGTDFEAAVCASVGGNVFHVAIATGIDENFKLIQATTKQGVTVFLRIIKQINYFSYSPKHN